MTPAPPSTAGAVTVRFWGTAKEEELVSLALLSEELSVTPLVNRRSGDAAFLEREEADAKFDASFRQMDDKIPSQCEKRLKKKKKVIINTHRSEPIKPG